MLNLFRIKADFGVLTRRFFADDGDAIAGTVAIEFAAVSVALALMTVSAMDIGIGFYRKMQLNNAVQAGAQYAAGHGFSETGVSKAVSSATTHPNISVTPVPAQSCGCPTTSGITTTTCGSSCSDGTQPGKYVTVSAQSTYKTILTYPLAPETIAMTAEARIRIP